MYTDETPRTETTSLDTVHGCTDKLKEVQTTEWVTPDFTEQSACAEICAYVFVAKI